MNKINNALIGVILSISSTQTFSKQTVEITEFTQQKIDKICYIEEKPYFTWEENLSEYRYINEEEFSKLSSNNKQICNLEVDITDTEYYFKNLYLYSEDLKDSNNNQEYSIEDQDPLVLEMNNFVKDFDTISLIYNEYISELKNKLNLLVKNQETHNIKEPLEVKRIREIFTKNTD